MKNRNSAADAASTYLRMAQDPNAGENFAVIWGTYTKQGKPIAILMTNGCSIRIERVYGIWKTMSQFGQIHYSGGGDDELQFGAYLDCTAPAHFIVQPSTQSVEMTSFASNLLLVAWAEDYIFILHAEYNKFARFSYTNNPALKAEIEPLLNQKLCGLYHSWELEREEKEEEEAYVEFSAR